MFGEQGNEDGSAVQEGGPDASVRTAIDTTPAQLDSLNAFRNAGLCCVQVALPIVTKQVMKRVSAQTDKVWRQVAKSVLSTLMEEQLVTTAIDAMVEAAARSMSLDQAQISIESLLDDQGRTRLYCSVDLASMRLTTKCRGFSVTDADWPVAPTVGLVTFKAPSPQILVPAPVVNLYERSQGPTRQHIERDDAGEISVIVTTPA